MKKFILLLIAGLVHCSAQSQNCAQLVYPANGQQLVKLFYDDVQSISNTSNGVELKWMQVPGATYYIYTGPKGGNYEPLESFPFGPGYHWTSDTSMILPIGYNQSRQWFVSTVELDPIIPCMPASAFSFTTAPPPPFCKPSCTNVLNSDFFAFYSLIPGNNMTDEYYAGFACQQYNLLGNKVPELMVGKSYGASLWSEYGGDFSIWIDYNDNGYFETGERVVSNLSLYGGNFYDFNDRLNPDVTSFYIPQFATVGIHRIRITSSDAGEDACSTAASMADGFISIIPFVNIAYGLAEASEKNNCLTVTMASIDPKSNSNNEWIPLVDKNNRLIASIKANGNNLGTVTVGVYENDGPVRTLPNNTKVLDRSVEINPQFQPSTPVDVRLYFSKAEFDALKAVDNNVTDISSINISKFSSGCGQPQSGYSFIGQSEAGLIDSFYYVQFTTTSFSDFFIRGGREDLPVSFVALDAKRTGDNVLISWQTATESNCKGFEVEYSTDGNRFNPIAFVSTEARGGTSNSLNKYSYNHIGASSLFGYYRIKQIDFNGKVLYSGIVTVKAISDKKFQMTKIYPNPSMGKVWLQLNAVKAIDITVEVRSIVGMLLRQKKYSVSEGNIKIELSLEELAAGMYFISLKDKDGKNLAFSKITKL